MDHINNLELGFKDKVLILLKTLGPRYRVYCSIRTPIEQAEIYTYGRTDAEIKEAITKLEGDNCIFLAGCLRSVSSRPTEKIRTKALPGNSWHHFGEAVDIMYIKDNGNALWNGSAAEYKLLAEVSRDLGLTSGYYFTFRDSVHVQMRRGSPIRFFRSLAEIDRQLAFRYGEK